MLDFPLHTYFIRLISRNAAVVFHDYDGVEEVLERGLPKTPTVHPTSGKDMSSPLLTLQPYIVGVLHRGSTANFHQDMGTFLTHLLILKEESTSADLTSLTTLPVQRQFTIDLTN